MDLDLVDYSIPIPEVVLVGYDVDVVDVDDSTRTKNHKYPSLALAH